MDLFAYYRAREPAEGYRAAALIVGSAGGRPQVDPALLRACVAWTASGATWTMPETECPETEQGAWFWLWDGCSVSAEVEDACTEYLDALGVPFEDARRLWRILQANRLIYPDGTIHSAVRGLAEQLYGQIFQG